MFVAGIRYRRKHYVYVPTQLLSKFLQVVFNYCFAVDKPHLHISNDSFAHYTQSFNGPYSYKI